MIALLQCAPAPLDAGANLELMARAGAAASAAGASLLCMPELFVTSYVVGPSLADHAEPLDGPSVRRACEIARANRLALVFGMAERDGDAIYNAAVAIDADGQVAGVYRKIHLFGPGEKAVFGPGTDVTVVELGGRKVGLAVCYDIEFPEIARALVRAGAAMICVPTANMHPYVSVPTTLVRARALENGVPVIYANHCGSVGDLAFTGDSAIVAFDGTDRARAGTHGEALLICEADSLFAVSPDDRMRSTQLADLRLPVPPAEV